MAKLNKDIEAIRVALARLAEIDPTSENEQAMKGMIKSIRDRLENFAPVKR